MRAAGVNKLAYPRDADVALAAADGSTLRRDSRVARYAKIVHAMGWENLAYIHEAAVDLVLLAYKSKYGGGEELLLRPSDVDLLISKNPFRGSAVNQLGDEWLSKWVSAHEQIRLLVKALNTDLPLNASEFDSLCQSGDPLALFVLGQLWRNGRFGYTDLAKAQHLLQDAVERIRQTLEGETDKLTKKLLGRLLQCAQSNSAEVQRDQLVEAKAIADAKELVAVANARAEERGQLLSALCHTLHNSFISGPEIIRTAVRVLGTGRENLSPVEFKILNDLAGLHSTFDSIENLIQFFKLSVSAPEKLLNELMAEQAGLPTIGEVVADSLRRNLARVLFHGNDTRPAYHLIGTRDYQVLNKLRAQYRYRFLAAEELPGSQELVQWVLDNLPGLQLSLARDSFLHPLHNRTQHALIFVIVSELLANAMKHSDDKDAIRIVLATHGAVTELSVKNSIASPVCMGNFRNSTGKLSFMDSLVSRLVVPGVFDASLDQDLDQTCFSSILILRDEKVEHSEYRLD